MKIKPHTIIDLSSLYVRPLYDSCGRINQRKSPLLSNYVSDIRFLYDHSYDKSNIHYNTLLLAKFSDAKIPLETSTSFIDRQKLILKGFDFGLLEVRNP